MQYLQFIKVLGEIDDSSLRTIDIHTLGDHIVSDIELHSLRCLDTTQTPFPETLYCTTAKGIPHYIEIASIDVITVKEAPLREPIKDYKGK